VLYLMLTGNCDAEDRVLRFRDMMDAIEDEHPQCIADRTAFPGRALRGFVCGTKSLSVDHERLSTQG
jgi:hypothetical protein